MAVILVVEDDRSIQGLLKALLVPEYQVVQAFSAVQAIEAARNARPDLVILNVNLGSRPNGLEVCRAFRTAPDRALARVPILILTGETTEANRREALAAGATSFMGKPFDAQALFEEVANLLARKGD
jgi:DNA-binding response OmpR family regulator